MLTKIQLANEIYAQEEDPQEKEMGGLDEEMDEDEDEEN